MEENLKVFLPEFLNLFNWRYGSVLLIMLAGIITGVVKYPKLSTPVKFAWILLILCFVSEFYSAVFRQKTTFGNSTGLHHLLLISRYILVAVIYYHFSQHRILQKISLYSTIPILLISLVFSIYVQQVTKVPSTMLLTTGTLISLLSLLSFLEMMKNPIEKPLVQQPLFWFNTGNLVFCGATSIFFGFYHFLGKGVYRSLLLDILYVANLILYICFLLMMVVDRQPKNKTANE